MPLPKEFRPRPFSGLITDWKMRLAPIDPATKKTMVITADNVNTLQPDKAWVNYTLPEQPKVDDKTGKSLSAADWEQQLVLNGFGTRVQTQVGKGRVQGVAIIKRKKASAAYLIVGGTMDSLWLNGKQLDMPTTNDAGANCFIGFHAGKLRIEIKLRKGANTLAMDNPGGSFFLGISKNRVWEEEYCKGYK